MHEFPPEFETADTKTKIVYRIDRLWQEFDQMRQYLDQHVLFVSEITKKLENIREEYLPVSLRAQNRLEPTDFSDPTEYYIWCDDDFEKLNSVFQGFLDANKNIGLEISGSNNWWLKEMWYKMHEEIEKMPPKMNHEL